MGLYSFVDVYGFTDECFSINHNVFCFTIKCDKVGVCIILDIVKYFVI